MMEMLNVVFMIQVIIIALLAVIYFTIRIQEERELTQFKIIKSNIRRIEWRIRELEASFIGVLSSTEDGVGDFIDDYINEDIKATHEFYVENEEDIAARYFETVRRKENVG